MRKITAKITGTNYVGITHEEELEVDEEATDDEIDSIVWDWALEHMAIETEWEEVE